MMSHEEQVAQHDSIKNIELTANLIKRWWPILAIVCMLIGAGASATAWFFRYDNSNKSTYATKEDFKALSDKVDKLTDKMTGIATVITNNHLKDSTNAIEIKATVVTNKSTTDQELAYIKNLCEKKLGFYQEHWNKDHSKLSVTEN